MLATHQIGEDMVSNNRHVR